MSSTPDYTTYTLNELVDARGELDPESQPERAAELDLLIRDRTTGARADSSTTAPKVGIARWMSPGRRVYLGIIATVLSLFLAINILTLVSGNLIAVVPVALQSVVLSLAFSRTTAAVIAIRLWAGIAGFGAIAYWISVLFLFLAGVADPSKYPIVPDTLTWPRALMHVSTLGFSVWAIIHARVVRT